ncbi:MAG TPA: hypothetical protein VES88_14050 [Gemmatimonadaceae bacterium]|nr:hypothetical protein [Gemmatimonadaceae bacterium]
MTSSSSDSRSPNGDVGGDKAERRFLRHTLATLAYRAEKPLRSAPDGFSDVRAAAGSRTAGEILAHMSDLLDWALWIARGEKHWQTTPPTTWEDDCERFFAAQAALDAYLAGDAPLVAKAGEIFQAPIADALTHTGQLSLLRRLADAPVRPENYARAHIEVGRVGRDQSADRAEFD